MCLSNLNPSGNLPDVHISVETKVCPSWHDTRRKVIGNYTSALLFFRRFLGVYHRKNQELLKRNKKGLA